MPSERREPPETSAFSGRTVLVISPQAWDGLKLSKHHFADELARSGSDVFFLNPPSTGQRGVTIARESNGVSVLDYTTFVRGRRFWPSSITSALEKLEAKRIERAMRKPADIVLSFDSTRFTELRDFKARVRIFHAVDKIDPSAIDRIAGSADTIFSVSDVILSELPASPGRQIFLNHGLAPDYAGLARERLASRATSSYAPGTPHRIGYVGNLLHPAIDHPTFSRIVAENVDAEIHLWGPYEYEHLNWEHEGVPDVLAFVASLKSQAHVTLHGLTEPAILARSLVDMDLLINCYDPEREMNRGSNNHKLLEYMSTGRQIVSNHVSTYAGVERSEELLWMPATRDNRQLTDLVGLARKDLVTQNSMAHQERRIRFALANTYEDRLRAIEEIVRPMLQ